MNHSNPFYFVYIHEFVNAYCEFCELEYEEKFTIKEKEELENEDVFHIAYTDIEVIWDDEKDEEINLNTSLGLQLDYCVSSEKYIYTLDDEIILEQREAIEDLIFGLSVSDSDELLRDGFCEANELLINKYREERM